MTGFRRCCDYPAPASDPQVLFLNRSNLAPSREQMKGFFYFYLFITLGLENCVFWPSGGRQHPPDKRNTPSVSPPRHQLWFVPWAQSAPFPNIYRRSGFRVLRKNIVRENFRELPKYRHCPTELCIAQGEVNQSRSLSWINFTNPF